jgi:DNA-binding Xre family transcriptional regulator
MASQRVQGAAMSLKAYLKSRKILCKDLAKAVDVSAQSITNLTAMKRKKRGAVSLGVLERIAKHLGLDLDKLVRMIPDLNCPQLKALEAAEEAENESEAPGASLPPEPEKVDSSTVPVAPRVVPVEPSPEPSMEDLRRRVAELYGEPEDEI